MTTRPLRYIDPAQIQSGVQRAAEALAPGVVRVRFSLDEDWTGDPSVFFRIVLSDETYHEGKLAETAHRIMDKLRKEVMPDDLGLFAYFNFRTYSEEAADPDPAWT